ncbi:MAG: hypothetical protein ACREDR_00150 [Blastocatellia bacterium]
MTKNTKPAPTPKSITIEFATQVRAAFGQGSQAYGLDPKEIAQDYIEFRSDRGGQGTLKEWLENLFAAEKLRAEQAISGAKKESRQRVTTEKHDELNGIRSRIRALNLDAAGAPEEEIQAAAEAAPASEGPAAPRRGAKKATAKSAGKPNGKKSGKKSANKSEPETQTPPVETVTAAEPETPAAEPVAAGPVAVPQTAEQQAPKVGDPGLATEDDFTNPAHPRLSDYRYYALIDDRQRVVGRGFLAKVDDAKRRTWFALRNDEQTALWKSSNWAYRQIDFPVYQKLTLEYLTSNSWPAFSSLKQQTPPVSENQAPAVAEAPAENAA